MTHTYKPYPIERMKADTKLEQRFISRIEHLLEVGKIKIRAALEGSYVEYGNMSYAVSRHAVLSVFISGRGWCIIEEKNRPEDFMLSVAEILTAYGSHLRKY